jgi:N-methylhydantoinase A
LPGVHISASYRICREWREYERTSTVVLNAYISPILGGYLHLLQEALTSHGYRRPIYIMQSTGGLMQARIAEKAAVQSLLSGPVGGNVASRALSAHLNEPDLVCVDMGGTSFDVSLVVDGKGESLNERELGGNPILVPMVDIHTIGAGGGSVAWDDQGTLRVGPRSAGATPGPACYGRGGEEATVTDANVVLGRIRPDTQFGGAIKLAAAPARAALERIGVRFNMNAETMAEGVLAVINAKMANAIRTMTIRRGIDVRDFALVAYGGAGPMHAVFIAEELGMRKIVVPNMAGAFSAWGMLQTEGRHDIAKTLIGSLATANWAAINREFEGLEREVERDIDAEVVRSGKVSYDRWVDLRYVGQEYFLNLALPVGLDLAVYGSRELKRQFDELYLSRYGHNNPAEEAEIVNIRVRARYPLHYEAMSGDDIARASDGKAEPVTYPVMFGAKWHETRFYQRRSMDHSRPLLGPLVVEEESCTTVVAPGYSLRFDMLGNMLIERGTPS